EQEEQPPHDKASVRGARGRTNDLRLYGLLARDSNQAKLSDGLTALYRSATYRRRMPPLANLVSPASVSFTLLGSTASRRRRPLPRTTGMSQMWSSSIRPRPNSVRSTLLVPYLMRSLPGWRLSLVISSTASPSSNFAFQVVSRSVVDSTYLGIALIRPMYAFPFTCPHVAANVS